ncbi:MAG TPA: Gfo/Idh/MocA family oxidoreductase [Actinomycetales bacterium]|nr:Gfo/Idh/MocA family oxidoreductase [Actinomycetales bacterium]
MGDLRIGVVGLGQRGEVARHAHRPGAGAAVVACADPKQRAHEAARELFGPGVQVTENYRDLLDDDLDAVMVLTPDHLHAEPVISFLQAGIPVFVEKPLAIEVMDCDRMLQIAMEHETKLYVGHNLRHAATIRAMRQLITEGAIGDVKAIWCRHFVGHGGDYYFKDWHAERRNTNGLLLQKGAHDLDVMHWLAGGFSRKVVALGANAVYGANPDRRDRSDELMPEWFDPTAWPPAALSGLNPVIDVEDISMMLARLDNHVLVSYQQCHFTPDYWRNYTVIGDRGRLENFGDLEGASVKVWNQRRSGYREDADQVVQVSPQEGSHGGADAALVSEFLRFVADGGQTETSPVAAREAVAAGSAATESLRTGGRPVDISPPDAEVVRYFAGGQVRRRTKGASSASAGTG